MSETLSVFDGSTFVVSDRRGDVLPGPAAAHGFFRADTRLLSRWELTVDGEAPDTLSFSNVDHFAAEFVLVPPSQSLFDNPYLSIIRRRLVHGVWREEIIVVNHLDRPVELEVGIEADADFADLFEVKDGAIRPRERRVEARDGDLVLSYRREGFSRETRVQADTSVRVDGCRLTCMLALGSQERRALSFVISGHDGRSRRPPRTAASFELIRRDLQDGLGEWIAACPRLDTDWDTLRRAYRRSLVDLAALRFYPAILPGQSLPAAGLPWFMTLFGRDSLITSFQALPFQPQLARTTLRVLAARQGQRHDAFRDEEPGKILHELRFGELTVFGDKPHSPYYGTADATPLFLVLLDEYERWSGDTGLVRELEPHARAALEWIDTDGDRDGDGYVEYGRGESETGLRNQGWKDSWNAIQFSDGTLAEPPIAICEVQGYVYDAKVRCARLAREVWDDPGLADRLAREAATLKQSFDDDFFLADRGYFALALDREKRPVDTLTSNLGHLLWSGIVDQSRADSVAGHLMGERMFSGWGVRTMAEGECGYNPIEYHNGTIWPHDNSIIAHGLARYGYRSEVARLAAALLDAAPRFDHCLPEVFAGYPRGLVDFAAEYPTASRPQAWAAGAPLLLLRAMLGLDAVDGELRSVPVLPEHVGRIALEGVPGRWGSGRVDTAGSPPDLGELLAADQP